MIGGSFDVNFLSFGIVEVMSVILRFVGWLIINYDIIYK